MQVINARRSNQFKNRATCKDKWGSNVGDFKKIYDYKVGTKNNQDYWSMTNAKKSTTKLPQSFGEAFMTFMMAKILGLRPIFNPPPFARQHG
jgi:hypothetical protein